MPTLTTETPEVVYLMERDFRLRRLIEAVGNLSYEVTGCAFSHVAHSVIEQMLSMKVGCAIEGRLAGLCGGEVTCAAVSALSMEQIRSCGIARRKAETLLELAASLPEAELQKLSSLADDEVRDALMSIRGIGRWTADMYLIFYLERPDVLPVEDGAIRQVFRWLYGAPLTDGNVLEAVCSLWRPYSSTAVRYMYRALNSGLLAQGNAREVLGF